MGRLWNRFLEKLDDYALRKKLLFLYLVCVLLPLMLTDSVIIYTFAASEKSQQEHEMENIAAAVQYNFYNNIDSVSRVAKSIYMNKSIDKFLDREFASPLEYVIAYQEFLKDTMLDDSFGLESTWIKMYSDNDTIINGGEFGRIDSIKKMPWYQYMKESGKKQFLYFYYDDVSRPALEYKRRCIYVRKLDFFSESDGEKILTLELDYSKLVRMLVEMNYEVPIYVCLDNMILYSNDGYSSIQTDFVSFDSLDKVAYVKDMNLYDTDFKIYILETKMQIWEQLAEMLPIIIFLICINILLPQVLMAGINSSFTQRIKVLGDAFECVEDEKLTEITSVHGQDEIGSLMHNYNKMVARTNELIQTVYKDRLKEQEMDIARKNAELLALQSQINPHFMFNALESIRMHSILKKEYETADMVEKLATMERQNVEWSEDMIELGKEMEFVKAYLGLQKYRFGDRISYKLELEKSCKELRIPRLTVVTFVENACVHGIESKITPGWIFVRVYQEKDMLCIEVEDTGSSMEKEQLRELQDRMKNASIELLKKKGRVGIVNACLRLKMVTNDKVSFKLEGEKGVGTMIQIRIPLECFEV